VGQTPPRFRLERVDGYKLDVAKNLPRDPIWGKRLERREQAVLQDPEHHGYHRGGLNHCKWAAPVERFFIMYQIDKQSNPGIVRLLAFYGPK